MGEGEAKKVQVVYQRVPSATAGALTEEQLADASNVELIEWVESDDLWAEAHWNGTGYGD